MSREDHSIKSIVPGNALAAKVQKSKRFPMAILIVLLVNGKELLKILVKLNHLKKIVNL